MHFNSHRVPSELIMIERVKVFLSPIELRRLRHEIVIYMEDQIVSPVRLVSHLIYEMLDSIQKKLEALERSIRWRRFQEDPDRLRPITLTLTHAWSIYSLLISVPTTGLTRVRGNLEEILKKYPDLYLY